MSSSAWHVLIDTDIGDDVDDAFALAMAARHPALRLCGVTTVSGPVAERARLAWLILSAAGHPTIPVIPGSSAMSDGRPGSARFSQRAALTHEIGDWRSEIAGDPISYRQSQAAASFIIAASHSHAPLTLIALGPLTTIAAALQHDPTLARRARLVAVAGKLGLPYPDWNVRCDPVAARRVLASGLPTTLVGMHVTMQCKLRVAQLRRLFGSNDPLARSLARCVLAWRTWHRRMPILHDALAVAVAADPTIVTTVPRRVRVLPGGFSLAVRRGRANALVCTGVNTERFHDLFDRLLFGSVVSVAPSSPLERVLRRIV